jgi:dienelactone hydrolase
VVGLWVAGWSSGCAVYQPAGSGTTLHKTEPTTNGGYYLYLPVDYEKDVEAGRRLPLVVSFHGMKPFDSAGGQIREWQQEADRYGYVVCAPELTTPDVFSPLPLDRVTPSLERDEQRTLAILDEIARTTNIDPNHVLSTSWSYGGYLAHYMMNRHPERFSCLAVRQSNFNENILDPTQTSKYRNRKVGVFYTENDLAICRRESTAAAKWYNQHGFDVGFRVFQDLGHERRPSMAASFFAGTCDATPKTAPTELSRLKVKEVAIPGTSLSSTGIAPSEVNSVPPPPRDSGRTVASSPILFDQSRVSRASRNTQAAPVRLERASPPDYLADATPRVSPGSLESRPVAVTPRVSTPVRERSAPAPVLPPASADESLIRIRLSSTIGISPLLVSYSVSVPPSKRNGAYYLWMEDGEPISNGMNGQKFLLEPGAHEIAVLVTTESGEQFRASQVVTVLERAKGRRP